MRRVVVTGIGVVSPIGVGVPAFTEGLLEGKSGATEITAFDVSEYSTRFACTVSEFDPTEILDSKEARRMSRFQQFALVAAAEAIGDADLVITPENAERVGVIVGSGIGGLMSMEEQHTILVQRGPGRVSPFLVPMMIIDLAAGHISIKWGAKGINYAPVSACASGNHALGEAGEAIRRGAADVVISGGFDCGVTPLGLAGFCAARALSTRNAHPPSASRPFDVDRDGFVIGEGGGILVLEELEHARARGARVYCELAGYGASADAYHVTAPAPDGAGARRAMEGALQAARLTPADVDYINAHGTSTPLGDIAESDAIRAVFGDYSPAVSSTKSMTGHLLGGAGALEAVASVVAMDRGFIPPTINLDEVDPQCELDHVASVPRFTPVSAALSNSFGFGGHNATVLFAKV